MENIEHVEHIEHQDEILIKGIRSLGYGQMPKIVMLDPSLSLEAKAIYAYFCSYTGSGNNTAFPGRDRILHDLNISKDRYYRYFSQLTECGYITVERKAENPGHQGFKHNVYTLENYPSKFDSVTFNGASEAMTKAYTQIRNTKDIASAGYGNVPKAVMLSSIPIESKGIYAYFCVFSGTDYESAPAKETILYHLNLSHNSFNKYIKALMEAGYISRIRSTSGGKFGNMIYHLNQKASDKISDKPAVHDKSPQPKIPDIRNPDMQEPDVQIPDMQKPDTQIPDVQFRDTINPSVTITKNNNTGLYQSFFHSGTDSGKEGTEGMTERNENEILKELLETKRIPEDICRNSRALALLIRDLTDWNDRTEEDFYDNEICARIYRMFVDCLAEMMLDNGNTYIQGTKISGEQVRSALSANYLDIATDLNGEEYASLGPLPDEVCTNFLAAAEKRKISNQRAYLKAIIWTTLQSVGTFR